MVFALAGSGNRRARCKKNPNKGFNYSMKNSTKCDFPLLSFTEHS